MKLFLDDLRDPPDDSFMVARSTEQAVEIINYFGWPSFISFDHDLGGEDKATIFLKKLYNMWNETDPIPEYCVHSANPIGSQNIIAFMESWKKSQTL